MRVRVLFITSLLAAAGIASSADGPSLEPAGGPRRLDAPIAVIVHGFDPRPGQLDPLAEELTGRGLRTYFFHYLPEERLDRSARQLGDALRALLRQSVPDRVVVVGYSVGGLIARRVMTAEHEAGIRGFPVEVDLVTIASPLGGFPSANWSWFSLGFAPSSFADLGTRSRFIRQPGALAANVRHWKIETEEEGTRRWENGRWRDDEVVALRYQRHSMVDEEAERVYRINAGHTHVVNAYGNVHQKLVEILDNVLPA